MIRLAGEANEERPAALRAAIQYSYLLDSTGRS